MTRLNKNMRKPIFIILIVLGFILPILAHAALVPCGRCCKEWGNPDNGQPRNECVLQCDEENVSIAEAQPCTLCDIFRMLQIIINYVWWALLIIAPLFIIAGGIMILIAGAKPDQLESGKKIITGTVIGLTIAFLSWAIVNMVFNTLAKSEGEEGAFPWPWNRIECTGGAIKEQEAVEPIIGSNNRYCHIQYTGANNDRMVYEYSDASECYNSCSSHCVGPLIGCEAVGSCCLDRDHGTQENPCGSWADTGWCTRSAPASSYTWVLNPPPGGADPRQRGDASQELVFFLDCMFARGISGLSINSISHNSLCTNPNCDTSTSSCGHGADSCHFGGANPACKGFSHAVDFYLPSPPAAANITMCQAIAAAARNCNSDAWINWEVNHVHVSIDNASCLCAERNFGTGVACPSP